MTFLENIIRARRMIDVHSSGWISLCASLQLSGKYRNSLFKKKKIPNSGTMVGFKFSDWGINHRTCSLPSAQSFFLIRMHKRVTLVYSSAFLIWLNSYNSWPEVLSRSFPAVLVSLFSNIFSFLLSELMRNLVFGLFSTSQVRMFSVKIFTRKMSHGITWVMRSWYHRPCFEMLFALFYCREVLKGESEIVVTGLKHSLLDFRS